MSRILGVDPGLTRCGYGLIDTKTRTALQYGMFTSEKDSDPRDRVGSIALSLRELIAKEKPNLIALERVFAQANLRSVMGVAQISGALMAIAHEYEIPLQFFTPSEVKAAVAGNGRASKDQVGQMVAKLLKLELVPKPPDIADALAVALCASNRSELVGTAAQRQWVAARKSARGKLG